MPVLFSWCARLAASLLVAFQLTSCNSGPGSGPAATATSTPGALPSPVAVVGTPTESPEFSEAFEMTSGCVQGTYASTRNARLRARGLELFIYANTLSTFSKAANQVEEVLCQDPPATREQVDQLAMTLASDEGIFVQSYTFIPS
jgi:hypothetical protein